MTAHDIIRAMGEVYSGCRTYSDTGSVRTEFHSGSHRDHETVRPFRTAFVRPDRFRFQYSDRESDRPDTVCFVVAVNGPRLEEWWGYGEGEASESLSMALAGATGVSGGSAHTVPTLLMPDQISGRRLTDPAEFTRLEDGESDGVGCYRISRWLPVDPEMKEEYRQEALKITGRLPPESESDPEIIWLDKSTFLIRRIDETTRFPDFRSVDVTTYRPVLNEPVSDELLAFAPPVTPRPTT